MKLSTLILTGCFAAALAGCAGEASKVDSAAAPTTEKAVEKTAEKTPDTHYSAAPSGAYTNEKTHAYITFSYLHQGFSKPFLRWRDWDSTLNWNADAPEKSDVSVTIKTASIDTGVDIFDEHLREAKWFDAAGHPEITFNSTSISKLSDHKGTMSGDLTIKGVTKPVTLDVKFNKAAPGRAEGSQKIGFSARGKLKRSDWGKEIGAYVPHVGDDVALIIEVEYIMLPTAQ